MINQDECGMCFAGKGEVMICSSEKDFFSIDINSKCRHLSRLAYVGLAWDRICYLGKNCGKIGIVVLASLLTDANVRKWLPDELMFMRQPPLRKYFIKERVVPVNLGCVQTLITLDGDDSSKKVTLQQFAKK